MKNLEQLIAEAEKFLIHWKRTSNDANALRLMNKTRQEAMLFAEYFEGRYDGLVDAINIKQHEKLR